MVIQPIGFTEMLNYTFSGFKALSFELDANRGYKKLQWTFFGLQNIVTSWCTNLKLLRGIDQTIPHAQWYILGDNILFLKDI